MTLDISIHALREEGDRYSESGVMPSDDFYPRPPRGGRHSIGKRVTDLEIFLYTPSARRATSLTDEERRELIISIHALREEGDSKLADKIGIIIS